MVDTPVPAKAPSRAAKTAAEKRWRRAFLATLAETSNVAASARAAKVTTARAYEARRKDPQFYREWQEALCEGYEHLEMSLLHRLREGEIKRAAGAKVGVRVFDNATSLRLLVVHRESVTRQQAIRRNDDARTVIAEINARILKLRTPAALPAPDAAEGSDDD
jgi:hypothetical protein